MAAGLQGANILLAIVLVMADFSASPAHVPPRRGHRQRRARRAASSWKDPRASQQSEKNTQTAMTELLHGGTTILAAVAVRPGLEGEASHTAGCPGAISMGKQKLSGCRRNRGFRDALYALHGLQKVRSDWRMCVGFDELVEESSEFWESILCRGESTRHTCLIFCKHVSLSNPCGHKEIGILSKTVPCTFNQCSLLLPLQCRHDAGSNPTIKLAGLRQ